MKFCPNCHLTYDDTATVCAQCGGQLAYAQNITVDRTDHTAEFSPDDISENKVVAMATYLLGWIGIIIAFVAAANSPYASFHAKQALKLEVCSTLLALITAVLVWTFIVPIVGALCLLVLYVVRIICFFNVCAGKAKEPAIISSFGFLK